MTPYTEKSKIMRLWNKVQATNGVYTGLPVRSVDLLSYWLEGVSPTPNIGIGSRAVSYVPGTTEYLTDLQIMGALAHELGHFVRGVGEHSREAELFADTWAVEHGYGAELVSCLEWFGAHLGDGEDEEHPPLSARLANIKLVMGKMEKKEAA